MKDKSVEYSDTYRELINAKPGQKDNPDDVMNAISRAMKALILYGLTPEAFKITLFTIREIITEILGDKNG